MIYASIFLLSIALWKNNNILPVYNLRTSLHLYLPQLHYLFQYWETFLLQLHTQSKHWQLGLAQKEQSATKLYDEQSEKNIRVHN